MSPNPSGVEILFEDNACLVVCKPAGLLTQAPLGIDSLENRIRQMLRARDGREGGVYLGVPHRLDRPVSGVIVFAKNVRAARRISEQFEGRLVEKTYWGLVEGIPSPAEGTWTDYLQKVEGEPRTNVVDKFNPDAKIAILHYRVVQGIVSPLNSARSSDQGSDPLSLLEITLETGRTHQIRAQSGFHKHPLVGDSLYGSQRSFGPETTDERQRLIALHARSLRFRHPGTKEIMTFTAELPDAWHAWGVD